MTHSPVSIVVVSRDRPAALKRCVTGLTQLQYPNFEIVVVADPAGINGLGDVSDLIKTITFDEPNISAARNVGINAAAGEIIAFIDDDAVPEPTWLTYLAQPFEHTNVGAVGGFVRGRNGISFQWKARVLDAYGQASEMAVDETQATILTPQAGTAIKTEGTNMAVRRDVLVALGGFDPAYAFYLDETDLNMRLSAAGYLTAIAPLAQVHHGFAASVRRRVDRVPTDLFEIGASWAVFQRKFIAHDQHSSHWKRQQDSERHRALSHMVSGGLEPRNVRYLMRRLRDGYRDGHSRELGKGALVSHAADAFKAYPFKTRNSTLETVGIRGSIAAQEHAKSRVKSKEILTLLILSPTALYHHVTFHKDGYWVQRGGTFGKSDRTDKPFKLITKAARTRKEVTRIRTVRGLSD
jgi:GT2 family glycosyltransferase